MSMNTRKYQPENLNVMCLSHWFPFRIAEHTCKAAVGKTHYKCLEKQKLAMMLVLSSVSSVSRRHRRSETRLLEQTMKKSQKRQPVNVRLCAVVPGLLLVVLKNDIMAVLLHISQWERSPQKVPAPKASRVE